MSMRITNVMLQAGIAFLFLLPATLAAAEQPATRIETDQISGVIKFIVKGKEQARLDSDGLHIRNGISYTGTMTDEGAATYDSRGAKTPHAP